MEVVILQVFVSLLLVCGSLLLFAYSVRQRDFEHTERLALLPIQPDGETTVDFAPPREAGRTAER